MKKIKDQRLIIENLKNIRIAFIIQSIGIIAILVYDGITKGVKEVIANPLWLVFIISNAVLIWKSLKISADMEEDTSKKKQLPYYIIVIIIGILSVVFGILIKLTSENNSTKEAIIMGIVVFISFLIPYSILYYLRKRRLENRED
ncbi:MAG TPA: hypothetical protein VK087_05575 [Tissierellaceae bacterium]|nr:hypothetical protein [Tissierellaceae bacterium]